MIPVGKTSKVDHCSSTVVDFEDPSGRKLSVEVRAYDDGVAFRYIVPAQPKLNKVRIEHELTEFTFAKDATLYPLVVDGFQSAYEDDYQMRPVSGIHHDWLIALPLLAEVPGSGWVGVTEADIESYAGMYLRKANASFSLRAELSPRIDIPGIAVETDAPVTTPWRVLMIGDEPGRLIESNMVLSLNPPSKIADTSWIRAGKSAWDWWSGEAAPSMSTKTGMNTATMKHYIDFASVSGFPYMLIDAGWVWRWQIERGRRTMGRWLTSPRLIRMWICRSCCATRKRKTCASGSGPTGHRWTNTWIGHFHYLKSGASQE